MYKVLIQDKELSGPPKYLTTDWDEAWASVKLLEALRPEIAVTGHGIPIYGNELRENLAKLARDFDKLAIPQHGKYLN